MMAMMIRMFFLLSLFTCISQASSLNAQVNWLTWEEAQVRNQSEPRKFIVDVYTQWCGWCKKMDKATFGQSDISSYINSNYYPVKFDAETKSDIQFKNKTYKYVRQGTSGYHELAAEITFGKLSFPTIVFLDEKMNIIQPLTGYKDPESMDKIMKYFAEDYYKTTQWKKYESMCPQSPPPPPPATPIKSKG